MATPIGDIELNPTIDWQKVSNNVDRGSNAVDGTVDGIGRRWGQRLAVGLGAVWAGGAALDTIGNFTDIGREIDTIGVKIDTVFGDQNNRVREWADGVNEGFGISAERTAGLAASMGDLLIPMGFAREQAADMTTSTVELAGALSAWSQGQYDAAEVSEILTKAMLGERDQLKSLGISISEADVQQRLLDKGQKDLTGTALQQAKALATQELIFEKTSDAQAAWSDGTFEAIQRENELKAKVEELKEAIGSKLLPIKEKLVDFTLSKLLPALERGAEIAGTVWQAIVTAAEPVLAWLTGTALPAIRGFGEDAAERLRPMVDFLIDEALPAAREFGEGVIERIQPVADWLIGTAIPAYVEFAEGAIEQGRRFVEWYVENVSLKLLAKLEPVFEWFVGTAVPAIQRFAEDAIEAGRSFVDWFEENIAPKIGAVIDAVTGFFESITWGDVLDTVQEKAQAFLDWWGDHVEPTIEAVIGRISDIFGAIDWGGAFDAVREAATSLKKTEQPA